MDYLEKGNSSPQIIVASSQREGPSIARVPSVASVTLGLSVCVALGSVDEVQSHFVVV